MFPIEANKQTEQAANVPAKPASTGSSESVEYAEIMKQNKTGTNGGGGSPTSSTKSVDPPTYADVQSRGSASQANLSPSGLYTEVKKPQNGADSAETADVSLKPTVNGDSGNTRSTSSHGVELTLVENELYGSSDRIVDSGTVQDDQKLYDSALPAVRVDKV